MHAARALMFYGTAEVALFAHASEVADLVTAAAEYGYRVTLDWQRGEGPSAWAWMVLEKQDRWPVAA